MPESASLETSPPAAASIANAHRIHRPFVILILCVTAPTLILDQLSKIAVKNHMTLYESITLIPNWLDITYTLNPGAAFSMFANGPPWVRIAMLLTLAGAAMIVLIAMLWQCESVNLNAIAFALVLAGAMGNFIDRASRGLVIDFVRMHYYDANFPIYNVADSAISVGVALIILASILEGPAPKSSRG